jgi:hypothetical protein
VRFPAEKGAHYKTSHKPYFFSIHGKMCEFTTKLFKFEKGKGLSVLYCSFMTSFVALGSHLTVPLQKKARQKEKKKEKRENTL